ncbi:protein-L-isoaspartate O-methyltransferase [Marinococcus halophilus]|uniref:Protein-L-isoaspartate O-methyltransferase n=1 Tax=Marinococcus halophilus TaxID=1371 RepID=A0A510Y9T3_MARHA|nr:protein-L-isoaspartate(D-aspartate) O-methyltransferase [Marinococcus halophilus]OZT80500.1 protein-L-isoaspartate O-methyltransferase [Marinococcus halophilus]GEK60140.1 protein-L-isoaspartate O-methyltransferase [Marinococcus halophilus]
MSKNDRDKEIRNYFRTMDRSFYMDTDKPLANWDQALSIGHGQTISQPSLVLKMTLELDVNPSSRVLEIGTGSGYQTALLAAFSDHVYTVERIPPLQERAQTRLKEAGFTNINFRLGDGSKGWAEHAPYDRIMVTAAAETVPDSLVAQLAAPGKMMVPVGGRMGQELLLVEKNSQGEVNSTIVEYVAFVPLEEDEEA